MPTALPAPEDPPAHAPRRLPADPPYGLVEALPETVVAELVDGQLYAHPRPRGRHVFLASRIVTEVGRHFDFDPEDPTSWLIVSEPEVHLRRDFEVVVPDVAGWKAQRLPDLPTDQRFAHPPDWVCEVLSPSTESYDRRVKLPLYAAYGVGHVWLADADALTVTCYRLHRGEWRETGQARYPEPIALPPFDDRPLWPWPGKRRL